MLHNPKITLQETGNLAPEHTCLTSLLSCVYTPWGNLPLAQSRALGFVVRAPGGARQAWI